MLYHWQRCLLSERVLNSLMILATVFISGSYSNSVLAQIVPDDTLGTESSVVTPNVESKGKTADRIDGGATRESNLFHSFSEFNVREGQNVYFASPESIENIFTRVTGNNPSNILGTLGVDGAANLLLLNPNGILFGKNSSLDVEGSFFGTTAESLLFRDGAEFSAVSPESSLLTITVPFGLQVGSNPGNILVQSPLAVQNGKNFSLVGGNIDLKGSNVETNQNGVNVPTDGIAAPGGRIELGGFATAGIVNFADNSNLIFPDGIARANIILDNFVIDTGSGGGGFINIHSQNLRLTNSIIGTGIDFSVESTEERAGDITIDTTEATILESSNGSVSSIFNITGDLSAFVESTDNFEVVNTAGNAGNIIINTGSLSATGAFSIISVTNGEGNAGSVNINANKSIVLRSSTESNVNSGIASRVLVLGTGNGADIKINTPSLSLNNASIVTTTVGAGNAGDILINATDSVFVSNGSMEAATFSSGDAGNIVFESETANLTFTQQTVVTTLVAARTEGAVFNLPDLSFVGTGRGGDITIKSRNLSAIDGVIISTATGGEVIAEGLANAGKLTINTDKLTVQNSSISTATNGLGKAGNLDIKASDLISLSGTFVLPDGSQVFSISTLTKGDTDAGDIAIKTENLIIREGAQISADTFGAGDGGNINIDAESIEIKGQSAGEILSSAISASTFSSGTGGEIKIITDSLVIRDLGFIIAGTGIKAAGNAGSIVIKANQIELTGNSEKNFPSVITALTNGSGDGGKVDITTNDLVISNGAVISVRSVGDGNAGAILVTVRDSFLAENGFISSRSVSSDAGDINITAGNIRLKGNSNIFTNVGEGTGGGGDITLTADSVVAFDDSDIFAFSSNGVGGDITIDSPVLFLNGFSNASFNANPESLEGNNRVDITATGSVSGLIDIPTVNFLPDSLVELSEKAIDTEALVANSCVARDRPSSGTFIITGKGGLPVRPGNWAVSNYSTGDVRAIPNKTKTTSTNNWQPGEPIVEPQGIYRLSNGKLVLSRECSEVQ